MSRVMSVMDEEEEEEEEEENEEVAEEAEEICSQLLIVSPLLTEVAGSFVTFSF